MNDLKNRTEQFSNALPLMQGRDKGNFNDIKERPVTIYDFGFMQDGADEYVVFTIAEDKDHFYFGGLVITENLKSLDSEGYANEIRSIGLPVMFNDKVGKNNRTYTAVTYYPEV